MWGSATKVYSSSFTLHIFYPCWYAIPRCSPVSPLLGSNTSLGPACITSIFEESIERSRQDNKCDSWPQSRGIDKRLSFSRHFSDHHAVFQQKVCWTVICNLLLSLLTFSTECTSERGWPRHQPALSEPKSEEKCLKSGHEMLEKVLLLWEERPSLPPSVLPAPAIPPPHPWDMKCSQ